MKQKVMYVPPLSIMYSQKINYDAHKKKLEKIKNQRYHTRFKQHSEEDSSITKRRYLSFKHQFNSKHTEIVKENTSIIKRLEKIKPLYGHKSQQSGLKNNAKPLSSLSYKSQFKDQQKSKENNRIRFKVKSISSKLNKDSMMKDYERAMKIKDRLLKYKTQPNQHIHLKSEKYLNGFCYSPLSKEKKLQKSQKIISQRLSHIKQKDNLNNNYSNNLKNAALYYQREDILKNKITPNLKLYKLVKERRKKALKILEKKVNPEDGFFPTEPSKKQ